MTEIEYDNCGWSDIDYDDDRITKDTPAFYDPIIMSDRSWRRHDGKKCTCYECEKKFTVSKNSGAIPGYYFDEDGDEVRIYKYYCPDCIDFYTSLAASGYEPIFSVGKGALKACAKEHKIVDAVIKKAALYENRTDVSCETCKYNKKRKYNWESCHFIDHYNSCNKSMVDERYCGNWEEKSNGSH